MYEHSSSRLARRVVMTGCGLLAIPVLTIAQPTTVSYQGYLEEGGAPAEGVHDFEFRLFDADNAGGQVGDPFVADDLQVSDGLFSTSLDFGPGAFEESPRFLEIGVRAGDSVGAFSVLNGRVEFQSVPFSQTANYATAAGKAATAQTAAVAEDSDALQGMVPADFAAADHRHSQLATPDGTNEDAVSVDNASNILLEGDIVLGDGDRLSSVPGGILRFESDGLEESIELQVNPMGSFIQGGGDGSTPFGIFSREGTEDEPDGTALFLLSGNGSDDDGGGKGGEILIQAGDGQGEDPRRGGDIRLIPGFGSAGGDRGVVSLDGPVDMENWVFLHSRLHDSEGNEGATGQLLSSTGSGTQWITPQIKQLANSDGSNPDFVSTSFNAMTVDGQLIAKSHLFLQDGMALRNTSPVNLYIDTPENDAQFRLLLNDDVYLLADVVPGNFFEIRPELVPASNNGITLRLKGGAAAAGGTGANGGNVQIFGGDAKTPGDHHGGDISLFPGDGVGTGTDGIVYIASNLGVFDSNPLHPIEVGTNGTNGNGAHVTVGGIWTNGSDRNSKTDVEEVDGAEVLRKVAELPVTSWRYSSEDEDVRHIGPMAQDFMEAFGLGESEKHIGTVDIDGVALVAIQELHAELLKLRSQNEELRSRVSALEEGR